MSTLMEQTQRLRKSAYEVERVKNGTIGMLDRDSTMLADAAMQLREAADTIADLRDTMRRESDARMDLQRDYNNQIKRIQNQRKQLREMQAPLKRETCRNADSRAEAGGVWHSPRFVCSECGVAYVMSDYASFCPNCGRRVAE